MSDAQARYEHVSGIVDDCMTVAERVLPENYDMVREALSAEGVRLVHEANGVVVKVLWCPTPEKPATNAWLVAITGSTDTRVKFENLRIGNSVILIPFRIPMDMWSTDIILTRGEWFEPIFGAPDSDTPVIFNIKINDVDIELKLNP